MGEELIWAFDEHIKPIQKGGITVQPNTPLAIEQRGSSLVISLEKTDPGVAYNLLIENAVKDYNEGNVLPEQSIWITTNDTLSSASLSYVTTFLPPSIELTTLNSSIQCANPPLVYDLQNNDQRKGRLDHVHRKWKYSYVWHWDVNSNSTIDSFERSNKTPLVFGDSNEIVIHSVKRQSLSIDSLREGWFRIYPKPRRSSWDSIVRAKGYNFSTYAWGHDTIYASRTLPVGDIGEIKDSQHVRLGSLTGLYSSDTVQAIVLVSDTAQADSEHLSVFATQSNNLDSLTIQEGLSLGLKGFYFISFSLPNEPSFGQDSLMIDIYDESGTLLLSDIYSETTIYSLYHEPSYAIVYVAQAEEEVLLYSEGMSAQKNFLVQEILKATDKVIFIND
ncbi:MAG: hypothetical protein ACPGYR_00630 [Chitinophagales bacterium]